MGTILSGIVLAAGAGSRLGEVGKRTSKPMLPVAGRPLVGWVVKMLRAAGVERLIFVGHPSDAALAEFVDSEPGSGLVLQPERKGIADALHLALPRLGEGESCVACACDSLYRARDVRRLIEVGRSAPAGAAVGVLEMGVAATAARSAVRVAGGRVLDIVEKPEPGSWDSGLVALPLYWLPSGFAPYCIDPSGSAAEQYVTTALRRFLQSGAAVTAVPMTDRLEITTAADIAAVEARLRADTDWFAAA